MRLKFLKKKRISNNCSIGAYYFPKIDDYRQTYKLYYNTVEKLVHKEKYIAPIYNHLIQAGHRVTINTLESSRVFTLSTPEDVKNFEKFGFIG